MAQGHDSADRLRPHVGLIAFCRVSVRYGTSSGYVCMCACIQVGRQVCKSVLEISMIEHSGSLFRCFNKCFRPAGQPGNLSRIPEGILIALVELARVAVTVIVVEE